MSEKQYFYIARSGVTKPFIDIFTVPPYAVVRKDGQIQWQVREREQHLNYGSYFIPQIIPMMSVPLGKVMLVSVLDEETKCTIEIVDGDVKHETQFIP